MRTSALKITRAVWRVQPACRFPEQSDGSVCERVCTLTRLRSLTDACCALPPVPRSVHRWIRAAVVNDERGRTGKAWCPATAGLPAVRQGVLPTAQICLSRALPLPLKAPVRAKLWPHTLPPLRPRTVSFLLSFPLFILSQTEFLPRPRPGAICRPE